jgi:hypothetical protein
VELVRVLTHFPEQHTGAVSGHLLPHVPQLIESARVEQVAVSSGKLPRQQDCPAIKQGKIGHGVPLSSFLRDPPSIELLTKKRLFVSLRWFSLVLATLSTEEAAINCMDIKATKTNTVVITMGDNLMLDILKLPNNNFKKEKKRLEVKIETKSFPTPHPSSQVRIGLSVPMGIANLSLRDNGCCWCMILENKGPIYTNCSSSVHYVMGFVGALK